jgi:hypothetical protein
MAAASWFEEASYELLKLQAAGAPAHSELLAMDHYACNPADYYVKYNPITKKTIGKEFGERFRMSKCLGSPKKLFKEVRRALGRGDERAWMFISSELLIKRLDKEWPRDFERFVDVRTGEEHQLIVGVRKKPRPPETARLE